MHDLLDREMREWLLDCYDNEDDQAEIEELNHDELVKAVNRLYDGGLTEFINCLTSVEV